MQPLRIAIIGFGKIAQDQHVPSIARNPRLELAATVSREGRGVDGVPSFTDHRTMLAQTPGLDAVAITTPPHPRYAIARDCLLANKYALLEKPPGVTLGEVEELARIAAERRLILFTSWHAQYAPAVEAAVAAVGGGNIASMRIVWREDVRIWHPGQEWIWEPGGFGVFDAGINALSIATRLVPGKLFLKNADLTFPAGRQAPIAARMELLSPAATGPITVDLDWRHSGNEAWTIDLELADGRHLELVDGGARLRIDGIVQEASGTGEYPALYQRFVDLIDCRQSSVDLDPLRIVAEAFLLGRRVEGPPFTS